MANTSNAARKKKLAERIGKQLKKSANKGVQAADIFFTSRLKEELSVPAPRRRVVSGPKSLHPGEVYYVATTPATPGAPPRKLSGKLRQSVNYKMLGTVRAQIGVNARSLPSRKYPKGFDYPRQHEMGSTDKLGGGLHPFFAPTLRKWRKALEKIIGGEVRANIKSA